MSYSRSWIVRLGMSIDVSSQEFLVNGSTVRYNISLTDQNKKISSVLRTRKILLTMMDETDIDDGGQPEAAVNEGNELKHSCLLVCPIGGIRDTMALVPSSRGIIYKRKVVSK